MLPLLLAPALILTATGDKPAAARNVEARRGDPVTLHAAVRHRGHWYTDAPRVRGVSRRKVRPLAALGDVEVRWSQIEPHLQHVEVPPPNAGNPAYSNNVLFGRGHGKWLGYDTLEYTERPLRHRGATLDLTRVSPSDPRLRAHRGLGTMRYRVEVRAGDGRVWSSPGAEATSRGGIKSKVRRVSFRDHDDLVGYLSSYFNVPNVFGSAGVGHRHQTELHQGADCADVIVGAARKTGAKVPYTSVSGLGRHTRALTEVLRVDEGALRDADDGEVVLRWGEQVQRGDLVLIKYGVDYTGRTWDHIAVLAADAGKPGVFDPGDEVLHMGYLTGLVREPLGAQMPGQVRFVRFKRRWARHWRKTR